VRLRRRGSVTGPACCACAREPDGPSWLAGYEKREGESWASWSGPQEGKGREEREKDLFFKKLFSNHFQTFKLRSNKKPCIRIMMHKHLLFLILFN
jgi:hypothetical protein